MRITFHRKFKKNIKKQPRKVQIKFKKRHKLFKKDQFHHSLNNHSLKGKYYGIRSINITGDIRAHYLEDDEGVIFLDIGSHSDLY